MPCARGLCSPSRSSRIKLQLSGLRRSGVGPVKTNKVGAAKAAPALRRNLFVRRSFKRFVLLSPLGDPIEGCSGAIS